MLLSWIDDHKGTFINDSWFKTDSDSGFITYKTLVSERSFSDLEEYMKTASYSQINTVAVRILLSEKKKMIDWIRKMPLYYETKDQIFVHAGVDEEAEDMWKWGTPDETFMWKFPATTGPFLKTVIAGHVGTSRLAKDENYHDIYHDGKSHYFIDGSVYKDGKLLLLVYDETTGEYMQL
jgi:serine/threonine protein phosphatase 1